MIHTQNPNVNLALVPYDSALHGILIIGVGVGVLADPAHTATPLPILLICQIGLFGLLIILGAGLAPGCGFCAHGT